LLDLDGRHVPEPNLGTGCLYKRPISGRPPGSKLGNALYRAKTFAGSVTSTRVCIGEDLVYFYNLRQLGIRFALCDTDGLIHRRHKANVTNDQTAMKNMIFDLIKRQRFQATRFKPATLDEQ